MTSYPTPQLATSSLAVNQIQKSAPVLDFKCLFTRDIRRKQKRWHDGRLKFHTFNKRIMVHDEGSNFVGDSYWQGESDLDEGEQLNLERNGILVEVGEYMGKRDQDLNELVDRRLRNWQEKAMLKLIREPSLDLPTTAFRRKTNESNYLPPNSLNTESQIRSNQKKFASDSLKFGKQEKSPNVLVQIPSSYKLSTKRRKRSLSPVRKSTYAQNLTGARVVLASKKPPCSALTSCQPVQANPLSSKSSQVTIDLTKDDTNTLSKNIHREKMQATEKPPRGLRLQKDIFPARKLNNPHSDEMMIERLTVSTLNQSPQQLISNVLKPVGRASSTQDLEFENFIPANTIGKSLVSIKKPSNLAFSSSFSHNLLTETNKSQCYIDSSSNISPISKKIDTQRKRWPRDITKNPNSSSFSSSSPETSEVNVILDRCDTEFNATISSEQLTNESLRERTKSKLRLKSRPRKMMFTESSIQNQTSINGVELNQIRKQITRVEKIESQSSDMSSKENKKIKLIPLKSAPTTALSSREDLLGRDLSSFMYNYKEEPDARGFQADLNDHVSVLKSKTLHKSGLLVNKIKPISDQCINSGKSSSHNNQNSKPEKVCENNFDKYFTSGSPKTTEKFIHHCEKTSNLSDVSSISLNPNKTSYMSPSLEIPDLNQQNCNQKLISKGPIEVLTKIPSQRTPKIVSKKIISNPATRGMSLQKITANTVDALNITGDIESPSSSLLSTLGEFTCSNNHFSNLNLENSSLSFGPWSRESFDLFGISKPPLN